MRGDKRSMVRTWARSGFGPIAIAMMTGACGDEPGSGPAVCVSACDSPPAATCVDPTTLRSYASPGACQPDGACTYGHVDFTCDNGCDAGACLGAVDACDGIVCDDPPAARCTGGALATFASLGTCQAGTCSYASVSIPCSHGCRDGACAGDPCADVACGAPPSPCHAPTGTCSSGVCSYAVLVGAACDDGAPCTQDDACGVNGTCAGRAIACQSPPAPVCDGAILRVAAATGSCQAGTCDYAVTEVPCPDGCQGGACLGDPCAGVTCDDPPSACHSGSGTCDNGVCAYAFDNGAACDDGVACTDDDRCTNGVCHGTQRSCTTPEPATCMDGDTLVARGSTGVCDGGQCSYVAVEVPCAFGCVVVDGRARCEGDPCGGVVCDAPEPATCANPTSLVVPSASGICVDGSCSYDHVVFTCPHGCQAGAGAAPASCRPPAGLTLSEVLVDSAGFPDTDAFTEIHGPPGTSLEGVTLVGINGNGGADYTTIALDGTLDSNGLYLVAHSEAASADLADLIDDDVDFQNGPDSVQLRFGDVVLDALAYGAFELGDVARGEGTPHAAAPTDHSLARGPDYADSDDNAADFTAGAPTPAAPNDAPDTPESPVTYEGPEQCFSATSPPAYLYDVVSNPVAPTTDGKLTVRFKGTSPYGPKPYTIELQTGAAEWVVVAVTNDSKTTWQTESFRVANADLATAIAQMGWLRFRHSYQYNGGTGDCMALTFTYNCERCFACPDGELDLGIGCRPTSAPYDYTALEHATGECGSSMTSYDQLYLPGTPPAAGDGTLSLEALGCGGTSIRVSLYTYNSGWVDIGTGSGGDCAFRNSTWIIPEAYLDAAIGPDDRIRFSWSLSDTCAAGTGCASFNDPCVRNAHLTYPR